MNRLAHRVALKTGHYDVDEMMNNAAPGMLQRWAAFNEIEPFGEEYRQVSMIIAHLGNELIKLRHAVLGKEEPRPNELFKVDQFIPNARKARKRKRFGPTRVMTNREILAHLRIPISKRKKK